jgi:type IV secretory pathway VirB4 component
MKAFQATPLVWLVSIEREEDEEEDEEDIDQFRVSANDVRKHKRKRSKKMMIQNAATTTDAYTATTPG